MSFDTTFDYTPVITGLTARKTAFQNEVTAVDAKLALLSEAAAYSAITDSTVTSLNASKSRYNNNIEQIDDILAEITVVTNLSVEQKADLYYFYTIVQSDKADYMARTLFNHTNALADGNISALRADDTTSTEAKTEVAKILYQQYPIKEQYAPVLLSFPQFVS